MWKSFEIVVECLTDNKTPVFGKNVAKYNVFAVAKAIAGNHNSNL